MHGEKDYELEIEAVIQKGANHIGHQPKRILEIGCGTGNHSEKFASRAIEVHAVDTDPRMVELALAKNIPNAQFTNGSVDSVSATGFDMACAMFNVVNYIDERSQLDHLFSGIRKRIGSNGAFVFDCWNGDVVRQDPPQNFERNICTSEDDSLTISATGEIEESGDRALIEYDVSGLRFGRPTKYTYSLRSRLWSPGSIRESLQKAGFSKVDSYQWVNPVEAAAADSWKLLLSAHG